MLKTMSTMGLGLKATGPKTGGRLQHHFIAFGLQPRPERLGGCRVWRREHCSDANSRFHRHVLIAVLDGQFLVDQVLWVIGRLECELVKCLAVATEESVLGASGRHRFSAPASDTPQPPVLSDCEVTRKA